ncbi:MULTISPECIES: HAD-IC family P-type ATPase [unclassified Mesorhizobium]|uniref:HAD-IC family P-type ATPase n=1 Tax=unclassified Mesorhizobium TaxID=325217 RepID=UPI001FE177F9|nr:MULTISPECIES: HAD-IC family P-type ATPase [unclassified Mesorhizobium]
MRRSGHVVGYLGDGINDAPALHEADIGISVDTAVDVAREAADIILLKRDLGVLVRGVDDGRKTFANTMKYISITTSANFGNMISMAAASLYLPFLPLLAKQILLNNFLSDIPALAIAGDNVDVDQVRRPRHWDIRFVRRFMVSFGLVSSLFDFATFAFLLLAVHATAATFQTAWFVESVLTELAIVLVVRTRRRLWRSRPSLLLAGLAIGVGVVATAIPFTPFAGWFGFVPLATPVMAGLLTITALYLFVSELTKSWLFEHGSRARSSRKNYALKSAPGRANPHPGLSRRLRFVMDGQMSRSATSTADEGPGDVHANHPVSRVWAAYGRESYGCADRRNGSSPPDAHATPPARRRGSGSANPLASHA